MCRVTKLLYARLALGNLWKNRQTYLPFLMAASLLTFAMYSFLMITFNPGLGQVHGGMQFMTILVFGAFVIALFTAIFLFYANSFLMKRRKKEMGLYSILGMEKRHIARVLRHELSFTWLLAMALGLALGILLSRLLFLMIRLAIRIEVPLVGAVSGLAMGIAAGLMLLLFVLLMGYNTLQVRLVSPIDLLHGGQTGEREPRARWLLALLGLVFTGVGYGIAQRVDNPMAAIALFFVAVILVILGTYLLFLAGSIALLKLLKHNRRYYYRARHFITVSGLLYRMKQNAAGLASIAILCTMAMITIGTTVAMYNGSERMLTEYYPNDIQITLDSETAQAQVLAQNETLARAAGVRIVDRHAFAAYETQMAFMDGEIVRSDEIEYTTLEDYGKLHDLLVLTEETFTQLEGETMALGANEIACYTDAQTIPETLNIGGTAFALRRMPALAVVPCRSHGSAMHSTYLVVKEEAVALAVLAAAGEKKENLAPVYTAQWNVQGDEASLAAYEGAVEAQTDWQGKSLRIKAALREEWYALHGGFLFVGIFLGAIFLMGTALILYFKQISEGYQDHERFEILQKVGMSPAEVRATVRRQVLLVFFLPLGVAVCHVAGSLHMMVLMLRLFGLVDVPYIALNTFMAALGVGALYGLFYNQTARTYYRMVRYRG